MEKCSLCGNPMVSKFFIEAKGRKPICRDCLEQIKRKINLPKELKKKLEMDLKALKTLQEKAKGLEMGFRIIIKKLSKGEF